MKNREAEGVKSPRRTGKDDKEKEAVKDIECHAKSTTGTLRQHQGIFLAIEQLIDGIYQGSRIRTTWLGKCKPKQYHVNWWKKQINGEWQHHNFTMHQVIIRHFNCYPNENFCDNKKNDAFNNAPINTLIDTGVFVVDLRFIRREK